MSRDPWLPIGFEVPGGHILRRLSTFGDAWQIYDADDNGHVLVAMEALSRRWLDAGLLTDSQMSEFEFGGDTLAAIHSSADYLIEGITDGSSPNSKSDAMAFAAALRSTRQIDPEVSLHDSIYVEEYSVLLPTYTISPAQADDIVLGTWLAGGIQLSALSKRRIGTLLGWMGKQNVEDIVSRAGLSEDESLGGAKSKPAKLDDQEVLTSKGKQKPRRGSGKSANKPSSDGAFHLPGRPALEKLFNEHVVEIVRDPERYKSFGIDFPTAIAIHGPPGCGKTFAVDRLVEFLDWPVFTIDSNSIGSPYIHETSKKVAETFDKAIDAAPSVIVIDEMESYLTDRQGSGVSGTHHVEEVAEFLRRIPEANDNKVLVIGMTNRIDIIDSAILRRGRFDHIIEVGMPSLQEVEAALKELLENIPAAEKVDIRPLAETLEGRPLSDAAYVVREAGRHAARAGKQSLDQERLLAALESVPERNVEEGSKPIGFIWNE